jgi:hypothetical protein
VSGEALLRSARSLRVSDTPEALELYFPAGRMPEVALPLAAFGVIAAAMPTVAIVAFLPAVLAGTSGLLAGVLLAGFVLPFAAFGAVFTLLAIYMATNALHVRIDRDGVEIARSMFGVVLKRRRVRREDIATIEPEIASRYQSLFRAEPIYHLVGHDRERAHRVVLAEALTGDALMEDVKERIGRRIFKQQEAAHG